MGFGALRVPQSPRRGALYRRPPLTAPPPLTSPPACAADKRYSALREALGIGTRAGATRALKKVPVRWGRGRKNVELATPPEVPLDQLTAEQRSRLKPVNGLVRKRANPRLR